LLAFLIKRVNLFQLVSSVIEKILIDGFKLIQPVSIDKSNHILTIMDHLTKWSEATPRRDFKSEKGSDASLNV